MPQIKPFNDFMQCSNTYMYTTHVIKLIQIAFWNTEKVFDKLVDIEINIIFKI